MAKNRQEVEVVALAKAYNAITGQPSEAWTRMLQWLNARIAADLAAKSDLPY